MISLKTLENKRLFEVFRVDQKEIIWKNKLDVLTLEFHLTFQPFSPCFFSYQNLNYSGKFFYLQLKRSFS